MLPGAVCFAVEPQCSRSAPLSSRSRSSRARWIKNPSGLILVAAPVIYVLLFMKLFVGGLH